MKSPLTSLLCSLLLLCLSGPVLAGLFENQEQEGERLYKEGRYAEAADTFQDSYRRGVAQYREGEYLKAAQSFQQVEREEVREAAKYNEGNSYFRAGNYEKAISAYSNVLKQNPEHEAANYNQNLARIMLAQASPEEASPPRSVTSSSWTILTICWPGDTDFKTLSPSAFSCTRFRKSRVTW